MSAAAPLAMALTVLAAVGAPPPPDAPPAVLTNEDIVRMVAAGVAESAIVEAIRGRPEAFDLASDMIEELTRAGVPASVVAAMRAKRAESAPATAPPPRTKAGLRRLTVTLRGAGSLRLPAWADEDAKEELRLPKENEQREVKDVAVFLACTSPTHIPDLWRSKTPLGRDMIRAIPHQMLAFVPGDTPAGRPPRLRLPATIEAEVDGEDLHDLVLGVAGRIGDRWYVLAMGRLKNAAAGPTPLAGKIDRGGGGFAFKVELSAPR